MFKEGTILEIRKAWLSFIWWIIYKRSPPKGIINLLGTKYHSATNVYIRCQEPMEFVPQSNSLLWPFLLPSTNLRRCPSGHNHLACFFRALWHLMPHADLTQMCVLPVSILCLCIRWGFMNLQFIKSTVKPFLMWTTHRASNGAVMTFFVF